MNLALFKENKVFLALVVVVGLFILYIIINSMIGIFDNSKEAAVKNEVAFNKVQEANKKNLEKIKVYRELLIDAQEEVDKAKKELEDIAIKYDELEKQYTKATEVNTVQLTSKMKSLIKELDKKVNTQVKSDLEAVLKSIDTQDKRNMAYVWSVYQSND